LDVIEEKLARARSGGALRVLDLFSGCGGLSLGFQRAGFKIAGAVEVDRDAAASHALNFHKDGNSKDLHSRARDITKIEPAELAAELAPGQAIEGVIDVIVGGPPCQAFARVGRAKLREVAEHPEAFRQDPRGNLYLRYLDYVAAFKPIAVLMENVPDALNYGGHNIAEEVCDALTARGFRCAYTLLNAVYYGVPEMRERMFVVAVSDRADRSFRFPQPSRWVELPRGYEGSRQVALKHLEAKLAKRSQVSLLSGELEVVSSYYVPPPVAVRDLPYAVSAKEAISDLPPITAHLEGKLKKGPQRFKTVTPYPVNGPLTDYALLMRTWPGFENDLGVKDHLIRVLSERDFEIFRRMCPGDEYPQAHRIALDIFAEAMEAKERARASFSSITSMCPDKLL
ncbi:MAG: DNA (cytosine-5-)-methyltransferase, partial [Chloroflexi bacterium]|nr:DNA (cytosine-5-)-methyltransferase [Chloroflexota bacterium]